MRIRRTTEVTVETRQVTVIRRRQPTAHAWCAACAAVVEMVTAEQAAILMSQSVRAIYRELERGRLHFSETAAGGVRLCLNSVLKVSDATSPDAPTGQPV
jgi:hypothetical protein